MGQTRVEILQISKYLARSHRLDFTSGLLATEEECIVIDVPASTPADLLQNGDREGLESLIATSHR
jgi:hypothetical protein